MKSSHPNCCLDDDFTSNGSVKITVFPKKPTHWRKLHLCAVYHFIRMPYQFKVSYSMAGVLIQSFVERIWARDSAARVMDKDMWCWGKWRSRINRSFFSVVKPQKKEWLVLKLWSNWYYMIWKIVTKKMRLSMRLSQSHKITIDIYRL